MNAPLPCAAAAALFAAACAAPGPGHDQTLAIVWQQRAAEYRAACQQAFGQALAALPAALRDPQWTACLEQAAEFAALPPAVVVDVDETMLDNSAFAARQLRAGITAFDPRAWAAWVRERQAPAVPGALAFARAAHGLGVRIVYVTNRKADGSKDGVAVTEESDTRENLARLGFPLVEGPGEDLVLTAGELGDKAARRAAVAGRYRIVQLVGDNLGDFAPGTELPRGGDAAAAAAIERARAALVAERAAWWGSRWVLIPNPGYGGFETVARAQFPDLRDALRTQAP